MIFVANSIRDSNVFLRMENKESRGCMLRVRRRNDSLLCERVHWSGSSSVLLTMCMRDCGLCSIIAGSFGTS